MNVEISQRKICERVSGLAQPLDDENADVRNQKVRDAEGQTIGEVMDLLVDPDSLQVRLMEVGTGGVLGVARKHHLVPIDVVTSMGEDYVEVSVPPESVREGPEYKTDFTPEDELDHYAEVYSWYQVQPYWQDGYRYPAYPKTG